MQKERALIANTLEGDIRSFEILITMYRNRVYHFLLKMTFSKEDAEDMAQEVFIRVYNNLYKYNHQWCFSTWIYKIAMNVFRTQYKKRKNKDLIEIQEFLRESDIFIGDSPEDTLESKENKLEILRMLDSLKADQKAALILKYVQGFSYQEIGDVLKMSPDNVKVRVMRAKKTIVKNFTGF